MYHSPLEYKGFIALALSGWTLSAAPVVDLDGDGFSDIWEAAFDAKSLEPNGDEDGDYPENLSIDNDLDTGRGRFVPTLSVDEYFAELALWFGAQSSDLSLMLPNLDRFYDSSSINTPIGLWS